MRISIADIRAMKTRGEKVVMLTAYDFPTARLVEEAGVPMILVGDSLGMAVLGYDSTIPVTMEDMIHHTRAVVRGTQKCLVVGDMPFMSFQISLEETLRNAGRFIQEAGATAVKLEGGETVAETVRRIVACGIPVMGHIGLTPQSINQLSGHKVQGKTLEAAEKLMNDAVCLEQAGAFAVVLELVPAPLSKMVTARVGIPTIGIGAGPYCDGQVQVIADLLGYFPREFKHAKKYADLASVIRTSVMEFASEVHSGAFPTAKQSYTMEEAVVKELGSCCQPGSAEEV
jgi:3-methyl-2-oxobutanoate hydroxymethyltransferase